MSSFDFDEGIQHWLREMPMRRVEDGFQIARLGPLLITRNTVQLAVLWLLLIWCVSWDKEANLKVLPLIVKAKPGNVIWHEQAQLVCILQQSTPQAFCVHIYHLR